MCLWLCLESEKEKEGSKRGDMLSSGESVQGKHRFYFHYSYSCNFSISLKLLQNKELKKIKSSLHTFENDLSIKYLTDCLSAKATFIVIHWNLIITLFPIKQYSI